MQMLFFIVRFAHQFAALALAVLRAPGHRIHINTTILNCWTVTSLLAAQSNSCSRTDLKFTFVLLFSNF